MPKLLLKGFVNVWKGQGKIDRSINEMQEWAGMVFPISFYFYRDWDIALTNELLIELRYEMWLKFCRLVLPFHRPSVAGVPDVAEGRGAVVGVVAEVIEVLGLEPDLARLVHCQNVASQLLDDAAAAVVTVQGANVAGVTAFHLWIQRKTLFCSYILFDS